MAADLVDPPSLLGQSNWDSHNSWLSVRALACAAALLVLVAACVLVVPLLVPPVTAAVLLRRAAAAESRLALAPGKVLHRSYVLEERRRSSGRVLRRRVETWQAACRGCKATREFDENGRLLAGEWGRADGSTQIISSGQHQPEGKPLYSPENIWRLTVSAEAFAKITEANTLPVIAGSDTYVVHQPETREVAGVALLDAKLTIRRSDDWPIRQDLVVRQGGEVYDYSMFELRVEQPALASISRTIFQPDLTLLAAKSPEPIALVPRVASATPELEIEVLSLLETASADLGEQLTVERARGGPLQLEGIVETTERRDEILRALSPVLRNPAVRLHVTTAAEALGQQARRPAPSQPLRADEVAPPDNKPALDSDLRAFFSRMVPAGQLESEISRFANRVFSDERDALQHAWAIKRLVDRFSQEELAQMDAKSRAKWLIMINRHAQSFEQHTAAVRSALQPIFFPELPPENEGGAIVIRTDSDLTNAAKRLFELGLANYEVVRAGFTVSSDISVAPQIKTARFWQSMNDAQKCARSIQQSTSALTPQSRK